jgi:hypothetical protein
VRAEPGERVARGRLRDAEPLGRPRDVLLREQRVEGEHQVQVDAPQAVMTGVHDDKQSNRFP